MRSVVIAVLVVVGLTLGACGSGPEGTMADHLEQIDEIMQDNMDEPAEGIIELREYIRLNLPEAMRTVGAAIVELDELEESSERRERLEEMLDRLRGPMKSLQRTAKAFERAASKDEEARAALERLGRRWESLGEIFEKFARDMDM